VPNASVLATALYGLLGLAAYRELLMTVDFPGKRVSFSRDTLSAADGKTIIATSREVAGLVGIPVSLNDDVVQLVLDTQGGTSISANRALIEHAGTVRPVVQTGVTFSPALGGAAPAFGARLTRDARIGQYVFEQPIVAVVDFPTQMPVHGIVGIHTLAEFSVALDQRTRRVRLSREGARIPRPPSLRGRGIAVQYGDGPLVARAVMPGGPAARAGVQAGDVIVGFGGRAIKDPEDVAAATLELDPGTKVTLDVLRNGRNRDIEVALGTRPPPQRLRRR